MKPLVGILLLAGFVRFFQLSVTPAGLYWDEADTGYQAFSLLKTGRDYYGNLLPAHLQSFADYRSGLYMYLAVPFVKLFGLSPLSVRVPAAVISLLAIAISYVFAYRVLKLGQSSWLLPLIVTFSPWTLVQGRIAAESQLLIPLTFLALITFFSKSYKLSAISFGLMLWAYPTAKIFIPVFLFLLGILYFRKIHIRKLILPAIIFALISWLPVYETFAHPVGRRFAELSIFNDPTVTKQIETDRQTAYLGSGAVYQPGLNPRMVEKLAFNKFSFWGTKLMANYVSALSTNFLFVSGDPNLRHNLNVPNTGQFYLLEIIPFIFGLVFLLKSYITKDLSRLLIFWLILAPLPAIFTTDGGTHAPRLLFLYPVIASIIAIGLKHVLSFRIPALGYKFIYVFTVSLTVYYLFTTYRVTSAVAFNSGFNSAARLALVNRDKYDHVVLDGFNESLLMAYLFESGYPPAKFQKSFPLPSETIANGVEGYKFGSIDILYPGTRDWNQIKLKGHNLVITISTQPYAQKLSPLDKILYPDSSPAFVAAVKSN